MPKLKFSKHTIVTRKTDRVILVGLLKRCIVELGEYEYERLCSHLESDRISPEIADLATALNESLILVDDEFDEQAYVVRQSRIARLAPDTFGMIIAPTMSCNMGCHYCFEQKPESDGGMTEAVVERLESFVHSRISDSGVKSLYLRWFGGEPLAQPGLVVSLSERLREMAHSLDVGFSGDVVTNGYFLTKELSQNLFDVGLRSIQVTLDGARRRHDRIRRDKSGGSSYDRIVAAILEAPDGLSFSMRIHVAPYNEAEIPELLKDLKRLGLDKRLGTLYFAPLFNYRQNDGTRQFQNGNPLYLSSKQFAERQVELHRLALSLGFRMPDPLDADYGVCTALRENTVVVNPDGSLTKCYMDAGDANEIFGSIDMPSLQPENQQKWRDTQFQDDDSCRECKFNPICLGGCAKQASQADDKTMVCTPLKYNAEELIPLHYE